MSVARQTSGPNILLVSNGYGEIAVATRLATAIEQLAPAAHVDHLPLVGNPRNDSWPTLVGPRSDMPSGGLVAYGNVRNLGADLRAGLATLTLRQLGFLRRQRGRDAIVAVGDIYCLGMCLFAGRRERTAFVATAKSNLVAPHTPLELAIARRAAAVFARDEATAASMRASGVRASYVGNIMMDGLVPSGVDLGFTPGALVIAVLPGSRSSAPRATFDMLQRLRIVASLLAAQERTVTLLVSIAPTVEPQLVIQVVRDTGIELTGSDSGPVAGRGRQDNLEVIVVCDAFADLLAAADVVVGQAGTANEQAAGMGKPVIAAAEPGEEPDKMRWYRMRQKKLLGDALLVLESEPQSFARALVELVDDPERMAHMSATGRDRMGKAGGAKAVAETVLALSAHDGQRVLITGRSQT